jgi:hypothetical protein
MPFLSVIIKITSDTGDVLRPGFDTFIACPVWCRTEMTAFAAAQRRLNRDHKLKKAAGGRKPSDVFHLTLLKTVRLDFSTWLWGLGASGITLCSRDCETPFEKMIGV